MRVRLLFQDEASFGRISDLRRCWAPLPTRPVVGHQIVREYVYALAAVCPHDGQLVSLIMPWLDSETMSVFLEHTARQFPEEFCIMVLDGAGWHRAKALRVPQTMALVLLPPYSPELNPVEHIWDHVRENALKNKAFESLDDVVDALCSGLKRLHDEPSVTQSLTCFDWINTLSMTYN